MMHGAGRNAYGFDFKRGCSVYKNYKFATQSVLNIWKSQLCCTKPQLKVEARHKANFNSASLTSDNRRAIKS